MADAARESRSSWLSTIAVLLLFVSLLMLVGVLIVAGFAAFREIEPAIAAALVAGVVAILGSALGRYWERTKELEQEQRKQKIPIYQELMSFWFKAGMGAGGPGASTKSGVSQEEVAQFMRDFTHKLITWGSDDVLREYGNLISEVFLPGQGTARDLHMMLQFEKMMFAIRKDVGYKNRGLRKGALLSLFINDIKEHLPGAK